ncbi:MAG: aminotransferase class I/II-fold pyridoxal phosphate-dependent enzyme, partial [Deltaproteobacteria bacterium]|nr:aminotransferase class I/II-fold pyridoxal phosphate-dependent enzyme [Deltaproteobacteria bacterium]
MLVSKRIAEYSKRSSWIRKMFEEGARLKSIHGPENVYDFSLGNPDLEPPRVAIDYMAEVAKDINTPHGYMPNAGYMDVRERIAEFATQIQEVDLRAEDIIMSCGAGGGLNVVLKTITDPGDEIIAIAPYFVEYRFYVENHGGTLVCSESNSEFLPDAEDLEKNITPRTKAIIINSPNNPTGRVYSETTLLEIKNVLASHPDIVVISDEPYRRLVYDGLKVPPILRIFPNSIVVTSASKELSLAG